MRREGLHARIGLQLVHHQAPALAGEAAMGVWTFCTIYSRLNELDGFVPQSVAERCWSGNVKANRAHLLKLCSVAVGLASAASHPTLGPGFLMLKYAEFNETKAEIQERRSGNRSRQEKYRESLSRVTNALVTDSDSDSGSSVSDLSDPELGSGSPRESFVGAASITPPPDESAARPRSEPPPSITTRPPDPFAASFLAAEYATGQLSAGADVYPVPNDLRELRALDALAACSGGRGAPPLVGEALGAWIRVTSADYRRAQASAAQYHPGFPPTKCLKWVTDNRPIAGGARGMVQPVPAAGRLWDIAGGTGQ